MTRTKTHRIGRVVISQELLLRDLGLGDGIIVNAYYDLDRLEFVLVVQHPKMPVVKPSAVIPRVSITMRHDTTTGKNELVKVEASKL